MAVISDEVVFFDRINRIDRIIVGFADLLTHTVLLILSILLILSKKLPRRKIDPFV